MDGMAAQQAPIPAEFRYSQMVVIDIHSDSPVPIIEVLIGFHGECSRRDDIGPAIPVMVYRKAVAYRLPGITGCLEQGTEMLPIPGQLKIPEDRFAAIHAGNMEVAPVKPAQEVAVF